MNKSKPILYDEEKQIFDDIDPSVNESYDAENKKENDLRTKLTDEDTYLESEILGAHPHGGGYLRAPNATGRGYLSAPNGGKTGGFFPLLPILGSIASMIVPSIVSKIIGNGMGQSGSHYLLGRKPNTNNVGSFYKDIYSQAINSGVPNKYVQGQFKQLYAGNGLMLKHILTQKTGGSIQDMKMGHVLMPPLKCHLMRALTKSGVPVDKMMQLIENNCQDILEQPIGQGMIRGGSIWGSLWNGIKSIFGKITKSGLAKKLGDTALNTVSNVAPSLVEKGINKLSDYANKKLDNNKELTDEDYDKMENSLKERKKKKRIEQLYEEEEANNNDEDYELPNSGDHSQSTQQRKKIIKNRQNKSVIPYEEPETKKTKKIIDYDVSGRPVYGNGYSRTTCRKKKVSGGSWVVKLERT
ncbi:hypothetical protein [Clostridium sp.]|uniref:hypothetical protein n=1 Tax=Clostridium sp. TaxID=1506 RepID=UPI00284DFC66|nr:hypothetical protein [Clostridium sp.]MDR3597948.1 hypothetical protein [Clostridium sp.]